MTKKHNVFVNDKVHVRSRPCSTCIFGAKSPVSVERRDGMVADCQRDEGVIPCHKHLYEHSAIEPVCNGFFKLDLNIALRLAAILEVLVFVNDDLEEVKDA